MTDSRYQLTESWLEILSFQNPKTWTVSWPKSISLDFQMKSSKKNKGLSWGVIWKPWFCRVGMEICLEKTLGEDYCSIPVRRLHLFFFFSPPPSGFFYLVFFLIRTSLFFPAVQGNHFFSHWDHALWRHVEFEMEKENGRISCSCNTWKKIKTCSVDLCYHQQLVTPGASTAFKHV